MWARRIVISLLLLIGLPLLGIRAGFALLSRWQRADAQHWQALGTPPEAPTGIADADIHQVYVLGQGGTLFVCDRDGPTRDNACWQEVDQVSQKDYGTGHDTYRGEIPAPPGTVIQILDVSWHHAERASYARYVLLDDGSVWLWDVHADANWSLVLLATGPICGLALAVVIVLLWWGVAGLRALWRRGRAKAES